jgi:hypothetical protein
MKQANQSNEAAYATSLAHRPLVFDLMARESSFQGCTYWLVCTSTPHPSLRRSQTQQPLAHLLMHAGRLS